MPKTRKADYILGCLDDSVFIDFNLSWRKRIYLRRISFDGYGCYELGFSAKRLSEEDSKLFIKIMNKDQIDEKLLTTLIKKAIAINKDHLNEDCLNEYGLC